jgi:hypothetical protein
MVFIFNVRQNASVEVNGLNKKHSNWKIALQKKFACPKKTDQQDSMPRQGRTGF